MAIGSRWAAWLDSGDDPDYRPQPEDVEAFQTQLQKVLQEKGY